MTDLCAGERAVPADAAHYLVRVHRSRVGDEFTAFDPESRLVARGRVTDVTGRAVRVQLAAVGPAPAPPGPPGDKPDRVLREATELGVAGVAWLDAARSVPALGDRAAGRRGRWRNIAIEAARQCGRGDVPEVVGPVPLPEGWNRPGAHAVLLHPEAREPLVRVLGAWDRERELALAIGPEGGFTEAEVSEAERAGFRLARIGSYTLRTETAAAAALGAVVAVLTPESLEA
jgi:16S rRNA (uracil1498-N3)-methyltransferase